MFTAEKKNRFNMPHKEMVNMVGPYPLINMLRNIKLVA